MFHHFIQGERVCSLCSFYLPERGKKTFIGICVAFPKMRENQTLNHPAYLRMCVMQKMLSTAWTGNGCVAGRLKSSLPRVTGRVSVELQFIYLFIITNKLFCLSASVFAVD